VPIEDRSLAWNSADTESTRASLLCALSSPPLRLPSHVSLNRPPHFFHNLSIPPSSSFARRLIDYTSMCTFIPPIHKEALHSTTPSFDLTWHLPSPLSHIDAQHVSKELLRLSPLVSAELPYLSGREHRHHTIPVVGFELLR
jgi:hypothetical protein